MEPSRTTTDSTRPRLYTNVALTLIAGLLAINTFGARDGDLLSQANAQVADQPEDDSGRVSAADQRKQIIAELKSLSLRLDRMDAMLQRGLSVKVTEMPQIVIPTERK
ncbi:MAG: hypothetical protein IPM33_11000 [Phycisphaerales bacterium]|nr:hypothetical protein [Phycisphaerales bacterium]